MEFLLPKQTPSSSTEPSMNAHQQRHPTQAPARSPVSRCLHLKLTSGVEVNDKCRPSPDKDVVLRRIRHHRWANKIRDAIQSASLTLAGADGDCCDGGWTQEDVFSSP